MSFVMPVSAHGHHYRQTSVKADVKTDTVCELCPVEDCTRTGLHVHDNVTYCGYAHGGGYCDGMYCRNIRLHEHSRSNCAHYDCDVLSVCSLLPDTLQPRHLLVLFWYRKFLRLFEFAKLICEASNCATSGNLVLNNRLRNSLSTL